MLSDINLSLFQFQCKICCAYIKFEKACAAAHFKAHNLSVDEYQAQHGLPDPVIEQVHVTSSPNTQSIQVASSSTQSNRVTSSSTQASRETFSSTWASQGTSSNYQPGRPCNTSSTVTLSPVMAVIAPTSVSVMSEGSINNSWPSVVVDHNNSSLQPPTSGPLHTGQYQLMNIDDE